MGDLFRHTGVDIAEDDLPKASQQKVKQSHSVSHISAQQETNRAKNADIFRFYNLQVELPKTFLDKLGDNKAVKPEAINLVRSFIKDEWPVLARKKRLTYRVSYDADDQVFNTIPLGKEAPLSYCCMRNVNFVFPRSLEGGAGKVLCTDPFCANSTLDTFSMTEQLIHGLFNRGLYYMKPAQSAKFEN